MSRPRSPQWLMHQVVVSAALQELDAAVLARLAECHPKASPNQLPDEIYARGLRALAVEFGIPQEPA